MAKQTVTSREFNRNSSAIKRAAERGPVFVTNRGEPSLVVMTFDHYNELQERRQTLPELLSRTVGIGEVEFEAPRLDQSPESVLLD